jgi:hypothetical protein
MALAVGPNGVKEPGEVLDLTLPKPEDSMGKISAEAGYGYAITVCRKFTQ